jgi:hypothetical protein
MGVLLFLRIASGVAVEAMPVELNSRRGIRLFEHSSAFGTIFCFLIFQNRSYFFVGMPIRAAIVVLWHLYSIA